MTLPPVGSEIVARHREPYTLRLKRPLHTSSGVIEEVRGELLRLETGDGLVGLGEACPLPGVVTAAAAWSQAEEQALLDIEAQRRGVPIASLLAAGAAIPARVATAALLTARHPADLAGEAATAAVDGFRVLKLKLTGVRAEDRIRLASVMDAAGPGVRIRVDANGCLTRSQAPGTLRELADLGVELIEQPLAPEDLDGAANLRRQGLVPMAADESIHDLASARAVLHARAADFLVLKPMRLGSLRLATEIAAEAREQGVEVFVTTVLEGAVGRSGALHLAAALDATRPHDHGPVHGLATGRLLRHDVATGPDLVSGHMVVPHTPGAGVTT